MPLITLETIEAAHQEVSKLIADFKAQVTRTTPYTRLNGLASPCAPEIATSASCWMKKASYYTTWC